MKTAKSKHPPRTKAVPPVVICLGLSHRDVRLAEIWLRWVSFLCTQPHGDSSTLKLIVFCTLRVKDIDFERLREAAAPHPTMFQVEFATPPDENELGYPGSASHLFLRALEYCEHAHPGHAMLWCETDTVAMRPGWAQEIMAEYWTCRKPFMGDRAGPKQDSHMTGNAIYPPNWRELALSIAESADPVHPSDRLRTPGIGRAWDVFCQHEITPQMHPCRTIQQIWKPGAFTTTNIQRIRPTTALFHQCKDASVISVLAAAHYPEFRLTHRPRFFMLEGRDMNVHLNGITVSFTPCAPNPANGRIGVFQTTTAQAELILLGMCGKRGVIEIDEPEYQRLMSQANALRLQR